ncbi:hypothetical protein [Bacillus licheniformis]|uniref:hypothetical protein n=1 Tax=Bacillus licheniformis TaxID=1402 RepID=UPI0002FCC2C9|nr:hypothetical protein [Bacillus licheniformis]MEC1494470.1 hypothetical protein [Bacillus licheniformis]
MTLLKKQYEMFKCVTDENYLKEYKKQNHFDWVNFDFFRKLHFNKRAIRFNHVFPKTKEKTREWEKFVKNFCNQHNYTGQRVEEDADSFVNFLSKKKGNESYIAQLAKHELNIYLVTIGKGNGFVDAFCYPITCFNIISTETKKHNYLYIKGKQGVRVFKIEQSVAIWIENYKNLLCIKEATNLTHNSLNTQEKNQLKIAIDNFKKLGLLDIWKRESINEKSKQH